MLQPTITLNCYKQLSAVINASDEVVSLMFAAYYRTSEKMRNKTQGNYNIEYRFAHDWAALFLRQRRGWLFLLGVGGAASLERGFPLMFSFPRLPFLRRSAAGGHGRTSMCMLALPTPGLSGQCAGRHVQHRSLASILYHKTVSWRTKHNKPASKCRQQQMRAFS